MERTRRRVLKTPISKRSSKRRCLLRNLNSRKRRTLVSSKAMRASMQILGAMPILMMSSSGLFRRWIESLGCSICSPTTTSTSRSRSQSCWPTSPIRHTLGTFSLLIGAWRACSKFWGTKTMTKWRGCHNLLRSLWCWTSRPWMTSSWAWRTWNSVSLSIL